MKRLSIFLVALALMSFVAGAGAFAAAAPKVLTIGVDQEAVGIDPHIVTAFSSMRRIDLMYNRLVRLDDNLAVVPDLAESWDIPNNLTYVFHLRKGVKFHNGREMTADDVQYSLQRIMDPKTASPGASYVSLIKSIDVVDKLHGEAQPLRALGLAARWAHVEQLRHRREGSGHGERQPPEGRRRHRPLHAAGVGCRQLDDAREEPQLLREGVPRSRQGHLPRYPRAGVPARRGEVRRPRHGHDQRRGHHPPGGR